MKRANYVDVTEPHISEDRVISSEELQQIENTINAHTCQVARSFSLCSQQGDNIRTKKAIMNSSLVHPHPLPYSEETY